MCICLIFNVTYIVTTRKKNEVYNSGDVLLYPNSSLEVTIYLCPSLTSCSRKHKITQDLIELITLPFLKKGGLLYIVL